MSVSITVTPSISPRSNTEDERLPAALWHAVGTVTGDVSAGSGTVTIQWPNSQTYQIYSLEFLSSQTLAAADVKVYIIVHTQMASSSGTALNYFLAYTALFVGATAQGGVDTSKIPIWVPDINGQWSIDAVVTNPGAGNTHLVTCWGYVWDRKAMNLPGGPIRVGETPAPAFDED